MTDGPPAKRARPTSILDVVAQGGGGKAGGLSLTLQEVRVYEQGRPRRTLWCFRWRLLSRLLLRGDES